MKAGLVLILLLVPVAVGQVASDFDEDGNHGTFDPHPLRAESNTGSDDDGDGRHSLGSLEPFQANLWAGAMGAGNDVIGVVATTYDEATDTLSLWTGSPGSVSLEDTHSFPSRAAAVVVDVFEDNAIVGFGDGHIWYSFDGGPWQKFRYRTGDFSSGHYPRDVDAEARVFADIYDVWKYTTSWSKVNIPGGESFQTISGDRVSYLISRIHNFVTGVEELRVPGPWSVWLANDDWAGGEDDADNPVLWKRSGATWIVQDVESAISPAGIEGVSDDGKYAWNRHHIWRQTEGGAFELIRDAAGSSEFGVFGSILSVAGPAPLLGGDIELWPLHAWPGSSVGVGHVFVLGAGGEEIRYIHRDSPYRPAALWYDGPDIFAIDHTGIDQFRSGEDHDPSTGTDFSSYGVVHPHSDYEAPPGWDGASRAMVASTNPPEFWVWDGYCGDAVTAGPDYDYASCQNQNINPVPLDETGYDGDFASDPYGWRFIDTLGLFFPVQVDAIGPCNDPPTTDADGDGIPQTELCEVTYTAYPSGVVTTDVGDHVTTAGDTNDADANVPIPMGTLQEFIEDQNETINEFLGEELERVNEFVDFFDDELDGLISAALENATSLPGGAVENVTGIVAAAEALATQTIAELNQLIGDVTGDVEAFQECLDQENGEYQALVSSRVTQFVANPSPGNFQNLENALTNGAESHAEDVASCSQNNDALAAIVGFYQETIVAGGEALASTLESVEGFLDGNVEFVLGRVEEVGLLADFATDFAFTEAVEASDFVQERATTAPQDAIDIITATDAGRAVQEAVAGDSGNPRTTTGSSVEPTPIEPANGLSLFLILGLLALLAVLVLRRRR